MPNLPKLYLKNRLISQIPQCTCSLSHNVPFRAKMCAFLFWMVHCVIWNRCIVRIVNMVKCPQIILIDACTKWPSHSRQRFQLNCFNTFRPRQSGRHFADDTFKRIFVNENVRISINISLTFVPKGLINNIPALVQIMAWRRPGDKPLSEPMMVNLLTHICFLRPG